MISDNLLSIFFFNKLAKFFAFHFLSNIFLFASLVSFDFYQFITPNIAFGLLALISLIATWLTLRFGPVNAGIGIIGSYSVPALVSTGSNNVMALLIYIFFVSLSAVWVAEYVVT